MRRGEERGVRRNLEAHAARMKELIADGMEPTAASSQALKDIFTTHKPASEYFACSCTICGWQGSRLLKSMKKPCPRCKAEKVFPNNPRVSKELP